MDNNAEQASHSLLEKNVNNQEQKQPNEQIIIRRADNRARPNGFISVCIYLLIYCFFPYLNKQINFNL